MHPCRLNPLSGGPRASLPVSSPVTPSPRHFSPARPPTPRPLESVYGAHVSGGSLHPPPRFQAGQKREKSMELEIQLQKKKTLKKKVKLLLHRANWAFPEKKSKKIGALILGFGGVWGGELPLYNVYCGPPSHTQKSVGARRTCLSGSPPHVAHAMSVAANGWCVPGPADSRVLHGARAAARSRG